MEDKDIRWIQRFSNYKKALNQLEEAVELMKIRDLSRLEKQGVIQAFEYTHELAWKTLKDFLENRGNTELYGSRDVVREAFKLGIIENGEAWMQMIKSRNLTSHTYDEGRADGIIMLINDLYFAEFEKLKIKMNGFQEEEGRKI
ncbi:nucleotidyltransferase substrate binding protein, HI0074 family [Geosporobacter subterraneus DSM 17957]|uniref:Nucleotidyltransferase substrate binding protein, HI0074 family n=1 Tax=Geosporobacter subterraneus DSM 17957 TaxID=1121919 RepID=A0A1M6CNL5_9FIRM|nr:nucleotidyltransferase substrate binding protein [Geosporobacter subterraneus]SHI62596.1 nucleotidyltransferase substrate binding protein, HI0074 family [Geosporobacter subterraneus DSM 17957]